MLNKLNKALFDHAALGIGDAIEGIDRHLNRRIDIAVTGLRRSGKTVFITSLIRNLLASVRNPQALDGFVPAGGPLVGIEEIPPGASDFPAFPTKKYLSELSADVPNWPTATSAVSRTELTIRYRRNHALLKRLSNESTLTLGIIDYPGEWLLELPLMDMSFEEWSRRTLQLLRTAPRAAVAGEFLEFLCSVDPLAPGTEQISRCGHELYKTGLARMRDELGLSFMQPGRFVMPDGKGDRPLLWFFPVDPPEKVGGHQSLWSILSDRYAGYRDKIVEPFFKETFGRCNRQVVLVDLLTALNSGPHAFEDTSLALDAVLDSLKVRPDGLLARILPKRFDKVLFGVTKADHVPASQRGNLAALLESMTDIRALAARTAGAKEATIAIASVCCTQDEKVSLDIGQVDVVVGKPIDSEKRIKIYPGVIPTDHPPAEFWRQERIKYPVFSPPVLVKTMAGGIPNINLGRAADFLLEDVLQ